MARQSIEIASGAFYRPGYLDRAAQEALLADVRGVIAGGAALPSAHAAFRQSPFRCA